MRCQDCNIKIRKNTGLLVCDDCINGFIDTITKRAKDVEIYDETRNDFLLRRSSELGLNYTPKEIRSFIRRGYTDNLILKTKNDSVWYAGSEKSKALPFTFR